MYVLTEAEREAMDNQPEPTEAERQAFAEICHFFQESPVDVEIPPLTPKQFEAIEAEWASRMPRQTLTSDEVEAIISRVECQK